jgi:hypothetical protein
MYLLDANIWLERLLQQPRADEVRKLLDEISASEIYVSDFSFHSVCVIVSNMKRQQLLHDFLKDLFADNPISVVFVSPEQTAEVLDVMAQYNLDFDDAYNYFIAEQGNLELVSFDTDFDQTPRGKKTPAEVLALLQQ